MGGDGEDGRVPTISEFHGVVIRMFHVDHPPPHPHASHGEHEAIVGLDPVAIVEGQLPAPVERRVMEWVQIHQHGLRANWDRARRLLPLERIDPLP